MTFPDFCQWKTFSAHGILETNIVNSAVLAPRLLQMEANNFEMKCSVDGFCRHNQTQTQSMHTEAQA